MPPTHQNLQGGLYLLARKARSSLLCLKASPSSRVAVLGLKKKSIILCGLFQTQELSLDFCHALPAETVEAVITSLKLDIAFAQLDATSHYIGTWWKHATAATSCYWCPKFRHVTTVPKYVA
jgi:hypothetical protein